MAYYRSKPFWISAFESAYSRAAGDYYDRRRSKRLLNKQKEYYRWQDDRRRQYYDYKRHQESIDELRKRESEEENFQQGLPLFRELYRETTSGNPNGNKNEVPSLKRAEKELELKRLQPEQYDYLKEIQEQKRKTGTIVDRKNRSVILYNKNNPEDYKEFYFSSPGDEENPVPAPAEIEERDGNVTSFAAVNNMTLTERNEQGRESLSNEAARFFERNRRERRNADFLRYIEEADMRENPELEEVLEMRKSDTVNRLRKMLPEDIKHDVENIYRSFQSLLEEKNKEQNSTDKQVQLREDFSDFIVNYSLSLKSKPYTIILLKELYEEVTGEPLASAGKAELAFMNGDQSN